MPPGLGFELKVNAKALVIKAKAKTFYLKIKSKA